MKKLISMVLVAAMLLACVIVAPASATDGVVYTVDAKVNGDKVDVTVTLSDNDEGLTSTCFLLSYNKEAIAPDMDSYEEVGKADSEFAWNSRTTSTDVSLLDDGIFVLHYDKNGENSVNDGVVLKITFDIVDETKTFDLNYDVKDGHPQNNCRNDENGKVVEVPYTVVMADGADFMGDYGVVYTLDAQLNGDKVDVTITLSDNDDGLTSTCFMLTYNKEAVVPDMDSYEEVGAADSEFVWNSKTTSTDISELEDGIFVLHYNKNGENVVKDGVVFKMSFDIINKKKPFEFNYDAKDGLLKNNSGIDKNGDAVGVRYEVEMAEDAAVMGMDGVVYTLDAKLDGKMGGKKVDVTITLSGNDEGLTSTAFTLSYNKNALVPDMDSYEEVGKADSGFAWNSRTTSTDISDLDDGIFVLHYNKNAENIYENGTVLKISFNVINTEETFDFSYGTKDGYPQNNCGLDDDGTSVAIPYKFKIAEGAANIYVHTHTPSAEAPTCTEDVVCVECGEVLVAAPGHTDLAVDAAVAPSCWQSGLTEGSHCRVCGEVVVAQQVVPATGDHKWASEYTIDKAAGIGVEGEKSIHCTTDGCVARKDITVIPAHRYLTIDGNTVAVGVGETISLTAASFEIDGGRGYVFDYWEVKSGNVELAFDKAVCENSFVMPNADVEINTIKYIVGDTDNDNSVTASDITKVILAMKAQNNSKYLDIDNDSQCTASDITSLIQIMKGSYNYRNYID